MERTQPQRIPRQRATRLKPCDTTYLDHLLIDDNGLVRPIEYEILRRFPRNDLMAWCVLHGVYQIPTWELIDWLKNAINGESAIEIGAGKACIGRYLGIPMTDSYQQAKPIVALYYATRGQIPAIPPADVERLDAHEAIAKYRPRVVIGAWITKHSWIPNDGNYWGVQEERILRAGCTYIHIGNADPHGDKPILKYPHLEFNFPWLIGRGIDKTKNRIWVWNTKGCR